MKKAQRHLALPLLFAVLCCSAFVPAARGEAFSRVVIDAGHGGHDRGAATGLTFEKHLALDVARRLQVYLNDQGIRSTLTRQRDQFISLPRRVKIANGATRAIFVSIHFNSASNTKATGIETFFNQRNSSSLKLAHMVQSAAIYKTGTRSRGVKHANFHVLVENKRPAILVECAFLSNSSDRYRALSPAYRQKMAEAIAMGIIKYRQGG